jgi:hypothetical protein
MVRQRTDIERRRYIRLDSVFPVDFRLVALDNQTFLSDWLQGFTNNVSRGGICLSVNNLKAEFSELIKTGEVNLLLNIQIPLSSHRVPAWAKPAWIKTVHNQPGQYSIGLSYSEISPLGNNRIVRYARMKYLIPRISSGLLVILILSISISGYFNWRLTKENRNLVRQLVQVLEDSKTAQETIDKINRDKEELNLRLAQIQTQIKDAEQEKQQLSQKLSLMEQAVEVRKSDERTLKNDVQQLALLIDQLIKERSRLEEELLNLKNQETEAAKDLLDLDQKKTALQQASFDNMYKWLLSHQNPRTGLIISFEGDLDIANWAFTYDQALVTCAFTYFKDFRNAQKILDFFNYQAKKVDGGFLNAYYANDGQPAEYIVHSGPNIWLGIAVLQYSYLSQDNRYLNLARDIADWVIQIQNEDKEGGIKGGPGISWYASEHNLDAYAFFNMFYEITGNQRYKKSAQKVLGWLLEHTYDRPDVPIRRGKGDSTIATDTYAWSIAALGPMTLEELGMRVDDIIKFAEDNCYVEVNFSRPDGNSIRVGGFDFAAQRNLARGGVISCEWTAQMILSFKILAEFYQERQMSEVARTYQDKAQDYLWQLSRMIISSPSPSGQGRGCLPYASNDNVDTGHGWITPKGSSTGSVAATTYTLFAYYGWNPLKLTN